MSSAKWLKAVALKWFNFKNSNEAVKHKCFSELTNEENSILSWLDKNIQDNKLDYDKQLQMPNPKSFFDEKDKFKNINFAPGMIDSFIGGFDKQDSEKIAKELIGLFDKLVDIYEKNEENNETYRIIDEKLGEIYEFLISHFTKEYANKFILLAAKKQDIFVQVLFNAALLLFKKSPHQEAIKFAICITYLGKSDEIIKLLMKFGLVDNFSSYVAISLNISKRQDEIFELAKLSDGYGRINYITLLEPQSDNIKKWLIYEGYKNRLGNELCAFECASKGNLLNFINNGWNEELYDCTADLICGLIDDRNDKIYEYGDIKEVLKLFLRRSPKVDMNLSRFSKLCEIFFFLSNNFNKLGLNENEKNDLINKISNIAYNNRYDWKKIIFENVMDYRARIIAKAMGIDIWDKLFEVAKNDVNFDDWSILCDTNNIESFKAVCELAINRFDLDKIATGPADELGLNAEFKQDMDLTMILQKMPYFDEICGIELVKAGLCSRVVVTRNMALKTVASWKSIPQDILEIIKKNKSKDSSQSTFENYDKILKNTN